MPTLHDLFQDIEKKEILPNLSHEASNAPIPKPDKTLQDNYRPITLMNRDTQFLNQRSAN